MKLEEPLKKAASSVEDIPSGDVKAVMRGILSVYYSRAHSDLTRDEFVSELYKYISESSSKELTQLREISTREIMEPRLRQLLEIDTHVVAAKASSLLYENDNVYYKSRVLTDIRPVFGEDPSDAQVMMLIHTLRIHYHKGEQHNDFFIALDSKDVQDLIRVLERAKAKAEALKALLDRAQISYIEAE